MNDFFFLNFDCSGQTTFSHCTNPQKRVFGSFEALCDRPMSDVGSQLLETIGTCSVCYETYEENGAKEPHTLPCGHTFCLGCIELLVKRDKPQCPVCRTELSKSKPLESYPKNFSLIQTINTLLGTMKSGLTPSPSSPAEVSRCSHTPSPTPASTEASEPEEDLVGDPRIKEGVVVKVHRQRSVCFRFLPLFFTHSHTKQLVYTYVQMTGPRC